MSNGSSFNQAKRTSTFILPAKRNKRSCTINTASEEISINNRSSTAINDDSLTNNGIVGEQFCDSGSPQEGRQFVYLDSDDDYIDMIEKEYQSLDTKGNTSTNGIAYLMDNNSGDRHFIDLTTSAHSNTTTPSRSFNEQSPTLQFTNPISPDLMPLDKFEEQGAVLSHALQHDVTPKADNKSNEMGKPNQAKMQPINIICNHIAEYEVLTLGELRNAIKKYGFKIQIRQSMIDILTNIQSFINTRPPTPCISALLQEQRLSININSMKIKSLDSQEFANKIKCDVQLWERILRYETVNVINCLQRLPQKEKDAYRVYLNDSVLVHNSSE